MAELTAITVCYQYADFLQHTLPVNRKFFDDFYIITDVSDTKTIELAIGYQCKPIYFNFAGRSFNKGMSINDGITQVKEGWCVHLDSDVIMPFPLSAWNMIFAGMDEENIYGCDRLSIPSFECFQQGKDMIDTNGFTHIPHAEIMERFAFDKYGGWVPIGFWQAWHSKHKRLYPENIDHAGDSDVIFAAQWPRKNRVLLPEASVLHLSTPDKMNTGTMNWFGRSTSIFGQSMQIG